jgi:hypothetical protein
MSTSRMVVSKAERYLRECLANKAASPASGKEIKTDKQVYDWLKSLGSARSAWETGVMDRLATRLNRA